MPENAFGKMAHVQLKAAISTPCSTLTCGSQWRSSEVAMLATPRNQFLFFFLGNTTWFLLVPVCYFWMKRKSSGTSLQVAAEALDFYLFHQVIGVLMGAVAINVVIFYVSTPNYKQLPLLKWVWPRSSRAWMGQILGLLLTTTGLASLAVTLSTSDWEFSVWIVGFLYFLESSRVLLQAKFIQKDLA